MRKLRPERDVNDVRGRARHPVVANDEVWLRVPCPVEAVHFVCNVEHADSDARYDVVER